MIHHRGAEATEKSFCLSRHWRDKQKYSASQQTHKGLRRVLCFSEDIFAYR